VRVGGLSADLRFARDGGGITKLEVLGKADLDVQQLG